MEKQKERYKKLDALRDPHKRGRTSPDKLLANHHLALVGGGLGIALDNLAHATRMSSPLSCCVQEYEYRRWDASE